jgi:putative membrane protein
MPPADPLERPFFGNPLAWVGFAVVLLAIPLTGFFLQSSMSWDQAHPAINALLNATSAVFLFVGFWAIKQRKLELHKRCMLGAFASSSLFLASYLARFYMSGTHRYPGDGWDKALYLVILFSHMLLAAAVVPMVLRSIFLGLKDRRDQHRRIARWTWPIWVYVSVTGIVVYLMLYPIASRVYGP